MATTNAPRSLKRICFTICQVRSYSAPADRSIPAAKQQYVPTSGTYPKGFLAGSAFAGVKASNTKYNDMALVVSETPCVGSAVFTKNIFQAAPVQVSRKLLSNREQKGIRGVVVNSGCANAVTGTTGLRDAETMARKTDECFSAASRSDEQQPSDAPQTIVMSTGVIGQKLPIDRITNAIPKLHESLGSTHEHWLGAAQAICTTDTFPKLLSRTFTLPSHPDTTYTMCGMTKGAGMIHPNMATLLGMICTDAAIHPKDIKRILREAANSSFNSISIDGDTSTNDTVALLANGASAPPDTTAIRYVMDKRKEMAEGWSSQEDQIRLKDDTAFQQVLTSFMTDLAKLVVRDGEGATKFVTIRVLSDHVRGKAKAKKIATSIATSSLVKTALYGKDANWGRILCAIGYTPALTEARRPTDATKSQRPDEQDVVIPARTSVSFIPSDGSEELKLLVRGEPEDVDETRAKEILEMEDLEILVRLQDDDQPSEKPPHEAVFYTCDFSHEYVTINGDYRT